MKGYKEGTRRIPVRVKGRKFAKKKGWMQGKQ